MNTDTTQKPLHAPLDEYFRQFEDLRRDVRQLTDGLSDHQLGWSPEAGRWSIAQCLEHLNAVAGPYVQKLEQGVTKARAQGSGDLRPVRYSWIERWLIRAMEPPPRRRFPAPKMFRPAESGQQIAGGEIVAGYLAFNERFIELLGAADGLDIGRVKISSPETRLLRLRIGAAFAFLASHERRHVWQARQIRENPSFPACS